MIAIALAHPHVFWLSLGGVLLAAEMLSGSGYLLWSGTAAVITGAAAWLLLPGWEWQGALFAGLTITTAWLWWRWLSGRVKRQPRGGSQLNQRGRQLTGQRFTLNSALVNGRGQLRVGDSCWPVMADSDLPSGTQVEVVGVEGITLRIRAITH